MKPKKTKILRRLAIGFVLQSSPIKSCLHRSLLLSFLANGDGSNSCC